MGNLSARERFLTIAILLIIAVFALQMLVLNPQKDKAAKLEEELAQYESQKAYLDQMLIDKEQNEIALDQLNSDIEGVEVSFIAKLNTEAIQNWVLKKFEDAGCPYLIEVNMADMTQSPVTLPDGSVSTNYLMVKRVIVSYSTTDGFNVPQYNVTPANTAEGFVSWISKVNAVYESAVEAQAEALATIGNDLTVVPEMPDPLYVPIYGEPNAPEIIGYEQFKTALRQIEAENPRAIKISGIDVVDNGGVLELTATIDFYSANLLNRVSTPDMSASYITFSGNVPTHNVGMIGLPLYPSCDERSPWAYIMPDTAVVTAAERPFATYYSAALFKYYVETYNSLSLVLGIQTVNYINLADAINPDASIDEELENPDAVAEIVTE